MSRKALLWQIRIAAIGQKLAAAAQNWLFARPSLDVTPSAVLILDSCLFKPTTLA